MEALTKLLSGLVDMLLSIVNGVIVGTVTFVINLLDGLDSVDDPGDSRHFRHPGLFHFPG